MTDGPDVPETWKQLRAPKGDRDATIAAFHQALIKDTRLFKRGDDAGREGAARALVHTIEFLNRIGLPNPVLEPLSHIAMAVTDLDRGVLSPILRPSRRDGRPPASNAEQVQDGVIAAIAEGFQRAATEQGWSASTAMSKAAHAMNASGNFPTLTATRVKNIRSKVKADFDTLAKDQFEALTDDPHFVSSPLICARKFAAAPLGAGNIKLRK